MQPTLNQAEMPFVIKTAYPNTGKRLLLCSNAVEIYTITAGILFSAAAQTLKIISEESTR
jgi:hypothetical protein